MSLNDESCTVRPSLVDLNPGELKYYPFKISLGKCNGSCNVLSSKISVARKTKEINVKVFNTITNKNEAKTMAEHVSWDYKSKFSSITYNSNQKWINWTCHCQYKNYRKGKKYCIWNPSTYICGNSKYLKKIADTSVIMCDKVISAMDILSTKMTNTLAPNLTKTFILKK